MTDAICIGFMFTKSFDWSVKENSSTVTVGDSCGREVGNAFHFQGNFS